MRTGKHPTDSAYYSLWNEGMKVNVSFKKAILLYFTTLL